MKSLFFFMSWPCRLKLKKIPGKGIFQLYVQGEVAMDFVFFVSGIVLVAVALFFIKQSASDD